jgi:hypothetical protein
VSKKFGEWYQKTNKTEDTNKLTLLAFKIIAILHKTLLATFMKLLETVSKGLCRNRSQNRCHTFLDCRHVCKTCGFHDALQAGKQKEVHPPYSPDLAPAFNKKRALFTNKMDLELRKKLVKCYIWCTAVYGAENWTLQAVDQKNMEKFEMWCWRRMEKISWTDHVRQGEEEYPT